MQDNNKTKQIKIGNTAIGGDTPIAIQSMLSIPSNDVAGNVAQAKALETAGCDIIRVAIPDKSALNLIYAIKSEVSIPLVADIHFDYRLAVESVAAGIDKIRINPGNIGENDRIKQVVDACKQKQIPIRIGVNAGSLEKHILEKYGSPVPKALVESALYHVNLLEKFDFNDIVLSIKSSDVNTMVNSYKEIAKYSQYPLHLGVTEAGTMSMGVVKSSIGIGSLLLAGIGDTIRVSLTADPTQEIKVAKNILKSVGKYNKGATLISCPTCGRTKINLIALAEKVEKAIENCDKPIKVAVMGCIVNGPGEAKEADIGIAGGDGVAILFKKGELICKVKEEDIISTLMSHIEQM